MEGGPSAVSIVVRVAETVALGVLLVGVAMPAPAVAAGGAAPDPAPPGAPAAPGPSPDPAPQAASLSRPSASSSTPSSSSSSSSSSLAQSVVSTPPRVASPPSIGSVQPPVSRTVSGGSSEGVTAATGEPRSLRGRASRDLRARHPLSATSPGRSRPPPGILAGKYELRGLASLAATAPAAVRHDGVLLFLSAMALGVLVISSLALLRLVRLNGQWWEGRAP